MKTTSLTLKFFLHAHYNNQIKFNTRKMHIDYLHLFELNVIMKKNHNLSSSENSVLEAPQFSFPY
jgi:hypothetical protein